MADQEGDIFPQMEREICECFEKLFQLITERKELLLRKLHSLKEEFEKQNTSNRNKIEQLASSKYELERVCQSLRGNQAVVQVEKGIADLEKEIRTVREEIRIPELSYHYSLNKLRECISQFGEIRDGQVRGRVECSDSNRASEIPEPLGIPRTNDKESKDLLQARYNRKESGPSLFLPKPNMQQPSYSPYDPSGQKDPLYPIAPPVPQPYYQQMPPKEDYHPEFSRASVIPEPTEPINILANMIECPVTSCRTLNLKKSFACSKCRMGLQSPGLGIVNPETSIIPGIIPVETWNCISCPYKNTTTQGRPRICEACNTTNSIPGPVSPQPSQYNGKEYPTHERERLYNNTKDTNPSFDQDPSVYHESPNYPDHIRKFPAPDPNYQNPSSSYQNRNPNFQMEKWNCSMCTFENTTAHGRPRICETCNTNNSMPGPVSPQPSQYSDKEYPTHERERLYPNPSYQNRNPSYQNRNPSYPNSNPSYPNSNPSYPNSNPSYPNSNPSYQNRNPSYPNSNPSYPNPNSNYQNRNPKYTDPIPTSGMTVPEVPVDHFDVELWTQVKLLAENPQEMDSKMTRKLLCELKIPTLTQLNLLLQLVVSEETNDKDPKDLLQAVKEVSDYDSALRFLNQECEICMESYTANDMIQMFLCPHSVCKDCYCAHFTNAVRNSAIKNWTCPVCSEPDIQQMEDPYHYFGLLSIAIQELCEGEIVKLFHQKVNEFAICKKPDIVIAIAAGVASQ